MLNIINRFKENRKIRQNIFYYKYVVRYRNKRYIFNKHVRIFTSGGQPIFYWLPRIRGGSKLEYWNIREYRIYWLGIELYISIGKDINGCYFYKYN